MTRQQLRDLDASFDREDWPVARRILKEALRAAPTDHWLLTRLSTTYYEERDYPKALELSKQALRKAPNCPLALWDCATALDMMGRENEAIEIWGRLLDRGVERVAQDECGEGLRWARSLINDCRYRMALAYADLNRAQDGWRWLQEHLSHRRPGVPSLYTLREVRQTERQLRRARKQPAVIGRSA